MHQFNPTSSTTETTGARGGKVQRLKEIAQLRHTSASRQETDTKDAGAAYGSSMFYNAKSSIDINTAGLGSTSDKSVASTICDKGRGLKAPVAKADSVMEVSAIDHHNTSVGERCRSSGLKTLGGTEDCLDHQQSSLCRIEVPPAEGITLQHEVSARKRRSSLVAGEDCVTRNEPLKIRIRARKTEQLATHLPADIDQGMCTPTKLTRE